MKNTGYCCILLVLVTLVTIGSQVSAHHSFAMFDDTKRVDLEGTIRQFQWVNPHAWVELDVINADGEAEKWVLQMLSPNVLRRMGWKRNLLKPGDEVSVVIHPHRAGAKVGNMISISDEAGRQIGGPLKSDVSL